MCASCKSVVIAGIHLFLLLLFSASFLNEVFQGG